ncbi:hypothetical protein M409DRAFT_53683 [Zasmidium cellare ATCC 36951]|uniref:Uncharacterized protein n=1 Tax=Zasmidium cellare ATCC 36951 TaxID=1080233 RepID=A0A6A6CKY5_ZASCE|nr:uncharacterized protein M409DRAFT_53683 [Zasmidium cellare ATCC 36951]KAF2167701.1 hypothetical protein M409DRAFT_53683 [Zasmidium cellare ATCC 36951]
MAKVYPDPEPQIADHPPTDLLHLEARQSQKDSSTKSPRPPRTSLGHRNPPTERGPLRRPASQHHFPRHHHQDQTPPGNHVPRQPPPGPLSTHTWNDLDLPRPQESNGAPTPPPRQNDSKESHPHGRIHAQTVLLPAQLHRILATDQTRLRRLACAASLGWMGRSQLPAEVTLGEIYDQFFEREADVERMMWNSRNPLSRGRWAFGSGLGGRVDVYDEDVSLRGSTMLRITPIGDEGLSY